MNVTTCKYGLTHVAHGGFPCGSICIYCERDALKALVREMEDFVLLFAAITTNPILENQARQLLSRLKAIMEGK